MSFKRKSVIALTLLGSGLLLAGAAQVGVQDAAEPGEPRQTENVHIGVFKSERVFEAYPGTQEFTVAIQGLQQEFMRAQETGDQQLLQEIQSRYTQMQQQLQQNFERDIKAASREVARAKKIDLIVSEVIYRAEDVKEVDLTPDLIEVMNGPEEKVDD